jgi:hypothetical protein
MTHSVADLVKNGQKSFFALNRCILLRIRQNNFFFNFKVLFSVFRASQKKILVPTLKFSNFLILTAFFDFSSDSSLYDSGLNLHVKRKNRLILSIFAFFRGGV